MTFLIPSPISDAAPSFITTVQVIPALINTPGWHVRDVDADRNPLRALPARCYLQSFAQFISRLAVATSKSRCI
jgi:hypothetical protein